MTSSDSITYLITGSTRGIGRELVKQLSQDDKSTVIAAVRVLDSTHTKSLKAEFPKTVIVKIDSEVDGDPFEAAKQLSSQGIRRVDIVFANAGILEGSVAATEVTPEELRHHFSVNSIAPLLLFQVFRPLLEASPSPKFVGITSIVASLELQTKIPFKLATYGSSKVAFNFLLVRLAQEHKNITTIMLHPGTVATDMSATSLKASGVKIEDLISSGHAITATQSVQGILKVTSKATLENSSGKFFNATDGTVIPW